jgi:hypothetical protein
MEATNVAFMPIRPAAAFGEIVPEPATLNWPVTVPASAGGVGD